MSELNCKIKNVVSGKPVEVMSEFGANYYLINTVHKYRVEISKHKFYEYLSEYERWINI